MPRSFNSTNFSYTKLSSLRGSTIGRGSCQVGLLWTPCVSELAMQISPAWWCSVR